jgi:hypothetical protein
MSQMDNSNKLKSGRGALPRPLLSLEFQILENACPFGVTLW